jgi:hypothetical protein
MSLLLNKNRVHVFFMHMSGTVSIGIVRVQVVITGEYTQHVQKRTATHQSLMMETKPASETLNTNSALTDLIGRTSSIMCAAQTSSENSKVQM